MKLVAPQRCNINNSLFVDIFQDYSGERDAGMKSIV